MNSRWRLLEVHQIRHGVPYGGPEGIDVFREWSVFGHSRTEGPEIVQECWGPRARFVAFPVCARRSQSKLSTDLLEIKAFAQYPQGGTLCEVFRLVALIAL
jgi:hypothetical protein